MHQQFVVDHVKILLSPSLITMQKLVFVSHTASVDIEVQKFWES